MTKAAFFVWIFTIHCCTIRAEIRDNKLWTRQGALRTKREESANNILQNEGHVPAAPTEDDVTPPQPNNTPSTTAEDVNSGAPFPERYLVQAPTDAEMWKKMADGVRMAYAELTEYIAEQKKIFLKRTAEYHQQMSDEAAPPAVRAKKARQEHAGKKWESYEEMQRATAWWNVPQSSKAKANTGVQLAKSAKPPERQIVRTEKNVKLKDGEIERGKPDSFSLDADYIPEDFTQ